MSKDWTPQELAAASEDIKASGNMSFEEMLAETAPDLKCYYYTFGTDAGFPYRRGWVIVVAHDWEEAHEKFRQRFPDRHDGLLNCAFFYDAQQWAEMNPEKTWPAYERNLHEIIT